MIRSALVGLAATLFAVQGASQMVKEVEVINFPDPGSVEVTNLPSVQDVNVVSGSVGPCEITRFHLVGFTSTLYTGNLGGILGSTQKCQLEFPGSRMCTSTEAQESTNLPASIPDVSWIDPVEGVLGRGSCASDQIIGGIEFTYQWTCDLVEAPCRFDPSVGVVLGSSGVRAYVLCNAELPIACCAAVP